MHEAAFHLPGRSGDRLGARTEETFSPIVARTVCIVRPAGPSVHDLRQARVRIGFVHYSQI